MSSFIVSSEDPFDEIQRAMNLSALISNVISSSNTTHCPSHDYITGDNDLPTCAEFDDPDWDQTFIEGLLNRRHGNRAGSV